MRDGAAGVVCPGGALLAMLALLLLLLPLALFLARRRRVDRKAEEEEDLDLSRAIKDVQVLDEDSGVPLWYNDLDSKRFSDDKGGSILEAHESRQGALRPDRAAAAGGGGGGGFLPSSGRGRGPMDDMDGGGGQTAHAFNVSDCAGTPGGASKAVRSSLLLETVTKNVMSLMGRKSALDLGTLGSSVEEDVWKPNPAYAGGAANLAKPVQPGSQRATTTTQWSRMPGKRALHRSVFRSAKNSVFQTLFGASISPVMSENEQTLALPASGAQMLKGNRRIKGSILNPIFEMRSSILEEDETNSADAERPSENRLLRMATFRTLSVDSAANPDDAQADDTPAPPPPPPPTNRLERTQTLNPLLQGRIPMELCGVRQEGETNSADAERPSENHLLRMATFRTLSVDSAANPDDAQADDMPAPPPPPPTNRLERTKTLNPLLQGRLADQLMRGGSAEELNDDTRPWLEAARPAEQPPRGGEWDDSLPSLAPEGPQPGDLEKVELPIELERAVRAVHGAPGLLTDEGTLHMIPSMGTLQGLLDFEAAAEAVCVNPALLTTAPGKVNQATFTLRDVLWGIQAALGTLAATPALLEASEAALRVTLPGMSEKLGGFSKGAEAMRQVPELLQAPMGLTDKMFCALASHLGGEKEACQVLTKCPSLWVAAEAEVAEALQALAAACGGMGSATEVTLEAPTALTWRQQDIAQAAMALEVGFRDDRAATLAALPALLCNPHLLEIADTDLMAEAVALLVEVFGTPNRAARAVRRCPALLTRSNSGAMRSVKKALQRQARSRREAADEADTGEEEALRVLERYPVLLLAKRHVIEEGLPFLEARLAGAGGARSALDLLAAHYPLLRVGPRRLERTADALEKALGGWEVVAEVVDSHPAALALTPRVIEQAMHALEEALGDRAQAVRAVRQNPALLAGGEKDFLQALLMLMILLGGAEPALRAVKEHPELLAASADELQAASGALESAASGALECTASIPLESTAGSKELGDAMARMHPPLLLASSESLSTNLPKVVELFRRKHSPELVCVDSMNWEEFLGGPVEEETDTTQGGFVDAFGEAVADGDMIVDVVVEEPDGDKSSESEVSSSMLYATLILEELEKSLQALETAVSTAPPLVRQWVQENHLPRIQEALLHLTEIMDGQISKEAAEILDIGDQVMNDVDDAHRIILDSRADNCADVMNRWKLKGSGRVLEEEEEGMSLLEIIRRCKAALREVEQNPAASRAVTGEQISAAGEAVAVLKEVEDAMQDLQ
ncbi:hypothetical protein CYMTET_33305, partial [Cymbomonas tetramitiformis]